MSFIKKIFEDKIDSTVHIQFSRFSKGLFENRSLIEINVTNKQIKIKTSSEFTNELVRLLANTIKEKTLVKGIIFSTRDLSKESSIKFVEIKNAMGVKKHIINSELTKEQIVTICDNFPNASINLSFKTEYGELKVKEKAPKSGKAGTKNKDPKPDYCVLITQNKNILKEYAFDINKEFKKMNINHIYIIEDIEIPKDYEKDFALARLNAKRIGKIIRKLIVDGVVETKEKRFNV